MRILFVSTNLPVPPTNGQAIRTLSIVQALASIGHKLSFVSFSNIGWTGSLDALSAYCVEVSLLERDLTMMSHSSGYLGRLGCLLCLKPYSIERFRSQEMRSKIQWFLTTIDFDLIVCDSLYALVNVPETAVPIVLNCHNVEYVIYQQYSRIETNVVKKSYAAIETHLMRASERRSCRRAAVAMTCSNNDRDTLGRLRPSLPIFVVPNAIDTDFYSTDEIHKSGNAEQVLLFQGGMDWYPNRDAVEFFARTILPKVRAEYPTVRFIVAGRNPPADFVARLGGICGVEFTGTVPDMRPYLSAATVVVVPLRFGSGTRIKILEACAAGKPIVSTRVGAEGLELEAGKEIILADDPAEFARSVVTLLGDPERRDVIARSGRAAVVERYGYPILKRTLETLIASLTPAEIQLT
jgi:polysaccharide biosynthesis protein PslH